MINDFALDYVEVHGVMSESSLEPVTERTLFQAASLTKSVSSAGILSLAQEGVVSLDAPINDYLTSWSRLLRPPSPTTHSRQGLGGARRAPRAVAGDVRQA